MKTNKVYIFLLLATSLVSCGLENKNQSSQDDSQVICDSSAVVCDTLVARDTVIESTPFLKNTTYIYTGYYPGDIKLADISYTPPAESKLNKIMIKINLSSRTAVVTTDRVLTHKIKSIKYTKYTQYYKDENGKITLADESNNKKQSIATIKTNKGTISIYEPNNTINNMGNKDEYIIFIKYGSYIAGNSTSVIHEMFEIERSKL